MHGPQGLLREMCFLSNFFILPLAGSRSCVWIKGIIGM